MQKITPDNPERDFWLEFLPLLEDAAIREFHNRYHELCAIFEVYYFKIWDWKNADLETREEKLKILRERMGRISRERPWEIIMAYTDTAAMATRLGLDEAAKEIIAESELFVATLSDRHLDHPLLARPIEEINRLKSALDAPKKE